jgi:hypothetical protein
MLEVYNGQAKVAWGSELVTFPVMCKAHNKQEAERIITEQICRELNVPPENIHELEINSFFWGLDK